MRSTKITVSAIQAEGIGCAQKVATLLTPDGLSSFVVRRKHPSNPLRLAVSEGGMCRELVGTIALLEK
jgi:hypothetical protein